MRGIPIIIVKSLYSYYFMSLNSGAIQIVKLGLTLVEMVEVGILQSDSRVSLIYLNYRY